MSLKSICTIRRLLITKSVLHLSQLLSSEVQRDSLSVARVVDFDVNFVVILVLSDQRGFQARHLILLPMYQDLKLNMCNILCKGQKKMSQENCEFHHTAFFSYHMWRFEGSDELAGLLVISVGGEGDVVHRHL